MTLGVHKNTVRNWLRHGLDAIDSRRPTVIFGEVLATFLQTRRQAGRQRCKAGEIFCLRCRVPVIPAGEMADYIPMSPTSGNLRAICPRCENLIHRRASLIKLDVVRGVLDIAFPQVQGRLTERAAACVNCDSERPLENYDKPQPTE